MPRSRRCLRTGKCRLEIRWIGPVGLLSLDLLDQLARCCLKQPDARRAEDVQCGLEFNSTTSFAKRFCIGDLRISRNASLRTTEHRQAQYVGFRRSEALNPGHSPGTDSLQIGRSLATLLGWKMLPAQTTPPAPSSSYPMRISVDISPAER